MRHHNANRKFGRVAKGRKALLNSLARSLVIHEKIKTTEMKAKELRPYIERIITRGKSDTVGAKRFLFAEFGKTPTANKIILKLSPKYKDRTGGYTRIIKTGSRKSDNTKMAVIEFV